MKLVNPNTGVDYSGLAVPRKKKYPKEIQKDGFMVMFKVAWEYLSSIDDLTGRDYRVLHRLLAQLDYENWIAISQQTIAEDLNLRQPHVARSIKKLLDYQIIEKQKDPADRRRSTYRFNPSMGWRGSADQWNKYMLENKEQKVIPLIKKTN